MFVSSFSTYITNDNTQKVSKSRDESSKANSKLFQYSATESPTKFLSTSNRPINYISQGQAQHNKQILQTKQEDIKNLQKENFVKTEKSVNSFNLHVTFKNAQTAYKANSIMFPRLRKPQTTTVNQNPKVDKELPQDIQKIKEQNIRHIMVNTYLANDNYYQITA